METTALKKFAQAARRQLLEQVAGRMEQVLRSDSIEIREKAKVVAELKAQIEESSKQAVIDRVAYTWFNRFCALRFMDVNHYTRIGVVSPVESFTQPEILQEAKQGHIDEELQFFVEKQTIIELLNGKRPSSDPQGEAYRLLLVGICNSFNEIMPFMFEKIKDYTELLMPLDLLSENSFLHDLREALTPEACQDVEVIGWLYQYYISERKDEVFEALKQNVKIEAQDIPAATQLFTPHWIVRYLVENSLGRLWMLNHPDSQLIKKMEYYIKPEEIETDFLKIVNPEELKICDPACGSGHMLTYAFELLFAIYEEEGYPAADIPRLILEKNLFGIEIDQRAGALSAFTVFMKARSKDRRFFNRGVGPNICVLENVTFADTELKQYMTAVGGDLFTEPLMETLYQFEQATNFGSLIRPILKDTGYVRGLLEDKDLRGDMFYSETHKSVLKVLKFAEFLSPRYHVVVANPPYMGSKGMNEDLTEFIQTTYQVGKSDLFAAFILRSLEIGIKKSYISFVTPYLWMFLTSYEKFRRHLFTKAAVTNLVQLEYNAFEPAATPVCAYSLINDPDLFLKGSYIRLSDFKGAINQAPKTLEAIKDKDCGWYYSASLDGFKNIPGFPVAYWLSKNTINLFDKFPSIGDVAQAKQGLITGDNDQFLRLWTEVANNNIGFGFSNRDIAKQSLKRWFPIQKGGEYRKWYGNYEYVVDWEGDGKRLQIFFDSNGQLRSRPQNIDYYFKPAITWTSVTIATFNCRISFEGFIYSDTGPLLVPNDQKILFLLVGLLNSASSNYVLQLLAPGMHYNQGPISQLPFPELTENEKQIVVNQVGQLIELSKKDWDSHEISWDFCENLLLEKKYFRKSINETYQNIRHYWVSSVAKMQQLEKGNNNTFLKSYGLQDELTPKVAIEDITLTCNPHYHYGGKRNEEELEAVLLADTIKEFISYAVGCMFGRYALDKPGLILANQGQSVKDYLRQIPKPAFMPDEDNVIPVLEGEWFEDDIAERFKEFLRITFGEDHYDENLAFIEESIGRDARSYFTKVFYKDHVQMYKKRPIYWMFSSPKGSFNALIYMHRYQPDTVSIVLDGYLREYIKKLTSHKSHQEAISVSADVSQSQKTKALREITQVNKVLVELKDYEREIFELASKKINIDLDDGVKVNYAKFGSALAKITGL